MNEWKADRLKGLKSKNGWLNLAGLFWLKEGQNSFGSDSSNSFRFPDDAPSKAGIINLKDSTITIHFNNLDGVLVDEQPAKDCLLFSDASDHPTHVKMGRYSFSIIKRGASYGVRLRDLESPLLSKLDFIPAYPVSSKWRIKTKLDKLDNPKTFEVNTVIGIPETYTAAGKLVFQLDGKEYSLIAFDEEGSYFIVFRDGTSSVDTYPAGRFLSAQKADSTGHTILDFNKATNPPCAFTPYATCPLPPRENVLSLKITAGEKDVHLYNH
jgi:uncharacterized protein